MASKKGAFNKFWKDYRRAEKRAHKYADNPSQFIEDQLGILKNTADTFLELRSRRSEFKDSNLVDEQLDRLRNAVDSRSFRILRVANPKGGYLNETKLRQAIKEAARGVPISKTVFQAQELSRSKSASTEQLIRELVEQGEGLRAEFKKAISQHEAISTSLVSFANTDGGSVYIGIAEEKDISDSEKAVPIQYKYWAVGLFDDIDTHRQKLIAYISRHTTLRIADLKIQVINFGTKQILAITVHGVWVKSRQLCFMNDNAYVRNDNANCKLTAKDVYDLIKKP